MASATVRRRCLGLLARHCRSLLQSSNSAFEISRPASFSAPPLSDPLTDWPLIRCVDTLRSGSSRHFASQSSDQPSEAEEEEEEDDDDDDDGEEGEWQEGESSGDEECGGSRRVVRCSGKTEEEKVEEAAEIGYKVVGPLGAEENPFKPYEPVFAVVQVGSHQFKVSNGDAIFVERLKFCEVNEKIILSKVLMLGSKAQTIVGRPILPDAAVFAVVEEHALDAKKIIFKKKRRKNYRRTKGHRQELTKLRITDIQGIEKLEGAVLAA